MKKDYKNLDQLHDEATRLIKTSIANAENFKAALRLRFEIEDRITKLNESAEALAILAGRLLDGATKYAKDHEACFETKDVEVRKGVFASSLVIDGLTYTMTRTLATIKRKDGGNLTKDFLAKLPEAWVKTERKLDTSGINHAGITDKELAKEGLYRPENTTWSRIVKTTLASEI